MTLAIPDTSSFAAVSMPRAFTSTRGAFGGAASVTASSKDTLDLKVVTDEGDVVTLSLQETDTLAAASYRGAVQRGHHGRHHGRGHGATMATASQSQTLSLTVQGDLNAQERADLNDLMQDITRAVKAFQGGDATAAREALAELGDLGSLQSFTFALTHEQNASVTLTTGGRGMRDATPLPIGAPVADDTTVSADGGGGSVCGVAEQA